MNEQNFGSSDNVDGINKDKYDRVVNSDGFANQVPIYADLIQETPTGETGNIIEGTIVQDGPVDEAIPPQTLTDTNVVLSVALLNGEESDQLRTRWNEIQGRFVDEPRSAVQQADALVSDVIEKITMMFVNEHSVLESQWKLGNDVSTEDLRKALQRYRSFFNRLVA